MSDTPSERCVDCGEILTEDEIGLCYDCQRVNRRIADATEPLRKQLAQLTESQRLADEMQKWVVCTDRDELLKPMLAYGAHREKSTSECSNEKPTGRPTTEP